MPAPSKADNLIDSITYGCVAHMTGPAARHPLPPSRDILIFSKRIDVWAV